MTQAYALALAVTFKIEMPHRVLNVSTYAWGHFGYISFPRGYTAVRNLKIGPQPTGFLKKFCRNFFGKTKCKKRAKDKRSKQIRRILCFLIFSCVLITFYLMVSVAKNFHIRMWNVAFSVGVGRRRFLTAAQRLFRFSVLSPNFSHSRCSFGRLWTAKNFNGNRPGYSCPGSRRRHSQLFRGIYDSHVLHWSVVLCDMEVWWRHPGDAMFGESSSSRGHAQRTLVRTGFENETT